MSMHAMMSHLMPMVPLGLALRTAGHDVLVAMPPNMCAEAGTVGLNTVAIGPEYHALDFLKARLLSDSLPIESWGRPTEKDWIIVSFQYMRRMRKTIDDYLSFARQWQPHLLIADPMELSARLAGRVLGVPMALHRWGLDPLTVGYEDSVRTRALPDCRKLGLDAVPGPDLRIDPCPPSIQIPGIPVGRPLRYEKFNGAGSMPRWALTRSGRPRVAVSVGTHVPWLSGESLIERLVRALQGLEDVEVVFAVTGCDPEILAPLRDRVVYAGPVPLNLFLGSCDAVIGHGGSGTTITAARLGVPQLVLPQYLDQFPAADGVAAFGNGISIDTAEGQRDIDRIRESIRTLLEDPAPKAAAARLAEEAEAMISPARLVAELEELAFTGVAA
jgi:UDP:flavonoid glycosyltransferase YjiC (YdhE family)